jgi:hypothetical protein
VHLHVMRGATQLTSRSVPAPLLAFSKKFLPLPEPFCHPNFEVLGGLT